MTFAVRPREKVEIGGLNVTIHELTHTWPDFKLKPPRRQPNETENCRSNSMDTGRLAQRLQLDSYPPW